MSRKQFCKQVVSKSVKELFERFVASQTVKGVSDKTIETYHSHLRCIAKHLDLTIPMDDLRQEDLEDMDLARKQVIFRHTKTGKIQVIPLCSMLANILSDYMAMRGGEASD